MKRHRFWHWPGWGQIGYFLLLGGAVALWFVFIYGGANFLTGQHHYRVRLYFDAELAIPFVPQAVLGYMSIYITFIMAPFILRTRRELRALARTLAVIILIAGVCFVIVPAEIVFPAPSEMGMWTGLVRFAKEVALPYNLAPSLHVAMSVVCITIYAARAGLLGRCLLSFWAAAIGLSTLLLHQHYVLDVITGFVLGLAGARWIYQKRPRGRTVGQTFLSAAPGQAFE